MRYITNNKFIFPIILFISIQIAIVNTHASEDDERAGVFYHQVGLNLSALGFIVESGEEGGGTILAKGLGLCASRTVLRERDWAFFGSMSITKLHEFEQWPVKIGPYLGFEGFGGFYFFDMGASAGLWVTAFEWLSLRAGYVGYVNPSFGSGWTITNQGLVLEITGTW